jgi:hypothetical protein
MENRIIFFHHISSIVSSFLMNTIKALLTVKISKDVTCLLRWHVTLGEYYIQNPNILLFNQSVLVWYSPLWARRLFDTLTWRNIRIVIQVITLSTAQFVIELQNLPKSTHSLPQCVPPLWQSLLDLLIKLFGQKYLWYTWLGYQTSPNTRRACVPFAIRQNTP